MYFLNHWLRRIIFWLHQNVVVDVVVVLVVVAEINKNKTENGPQSLSRRIDLDSAADDVRLLLQRTTRLQCTTMHSAFKLFSNFFKF